MRRRPAKSLETSVTRAHGDDITGESHCPPDDRAATAGVRVRPDRSPGFVHLLPAAALLLALGGCGEDAPPTPSGNRVFHATPDGAGSDCGSLQACLDAAADGDTVELAGGRYITVGDTLTPPFAGVGPVVANMVLRGAPRSLVIRARPGETPIIDGRGDSGRIGLGLPANLLRVRVQGLRFERCWAGVRATGGQVTLVACQFELGEHGLVADDTSLEVVDCLFADQFNESLLLRASGGTIDRLEVLGSGAGLFVAAGRNLHISRSRFGPFCQSGLRFEEGGTARLATSTVYGAGMVQVDSSGVVVAGGAALAIERSIVASNRGFGIDCRTGGTVTVSCSDIWNNSGGDYRGCPVATGQNGVISADPRFCATRATLDLHLAPDSPARNAACGAMGAYGATACNPAAPAGFRE